MLERHTVLRSNADTQITMLLRATDTGRREAVVLFRLEWATDPKRILDTSGANKQ